MFVLKTFRTALFGPGLKILRPISGLNPLCYHDGSSSTFSLPLDRRIPSTCGCRFTTLTHRQITHRQESRSSSRTSNASYIFALVISIVGLHGWYNQQLNASEKSEEEHSIALLKSSKRGDIDRLRKLIQKGVSTPL